MKTNRAKRTQRISRALTTLRRQLSKPIWLPENAFGSFKRPTIQTSFRITALLALLTLATSCASFNPASMQAGAVAELWTFRAGAQIYTGDKNGPTSPSAEFLAVTTELFDFAVNFGIPANITVRVGINDHPHIGGGGYLGARLK